MDRNYLTLVHGLDPSVAPGVQLVTTLEAGQLTGPAPHADMMV